MSWADQQRINRFSRLHARFSDVEEELKARRTEREELEDLGMELELLSDARRTRGSSCTSWNRYWNDEAIRNEPHGGARKVADPDLGPPIARLSLSTLTRLISPPADDT